MSKLALIYYPDGLDQDAEISKWEDYGLKAMVWGGNTLALKSGKVLLEDFFAGGKDDEIRETGLGVVLNWV